MSIKCGYTINRVVSRINHYIDKLDLNLEGYNVLTEVGSGLYNYTPIIPMLAGANRVMAWTRDSVYGKADDIIAECRLKLNKMGYDDSIEFFNGTLNKYHLKQADIITNSGFLRPLNEEKLKHVKQTVAIPLMYESWELRKEDINIDYCQTNNIKVAGTNENHDIINVFNHIGPLAVKMAFEAGYEVYGNNIIIWSDDNFGNVITEAFAKMNPKNLLMTTNISEVKKQIVDTDFIFVSDYDEKRSYTNNNFFGLKELSLLNSDFGLVHLYGDLDYKEIKRMGISLSPSKNGHAQKMSFTLNHLGINPFIALITAGFKVGQYLLENDFNNDLVQIV